MGGLFGDPVGWSGSMVKSWGRFWLFAAFFVVLVGVVVIQAAFEGVRSALGAAIFLGMFQLMFLYAMRRMYVQITTGKVRDAA